MKKAFRRLCNVIIAVTVGVRDAFEIEVPTIWQGMRASDDALSADGDGSTFPGVPGRTGR